MGLLSALALALALPSAGLAAGTGALTQVAVPAGCASNDGTVGDCTQTSPLVNPQRVAVSPDGKQVYVGATGSGAIVVLNRNAKTGSLTKASCVSNGTASDCAHPVTPLVGPEGLAISKDGKYVFVAVTPTNVANAAVVSFARDKKNGRLSRVNCISNQPFADCTDGVALAGARDVAISQDGKNLYVASNGSNAVAVLSVDKKTGTITQATGADGCVSSDGTGGACVQGDGLGKPQSVAVSADGRNVYVTSMGSDAVAMFGRDKKTGVLTPLGCIANDGAGGCADGAALDGAYGVAISQDGKNVYVTANASGAVVVFTRDTKTGLLTQLASPDGCVSAGGAGGECETGNALDGPQGVAISSDGKSAYVIGNTSDAVAAFSRDK